MIQRMFNCKPSGTCTGKHVASRVGRNGGGCFEGGDCRGVGSKFRVRGRLTGCGQIFDPAPEHTPKLIVICKI